jgi:hypothetical protein
MARVELSPDNRRCLDFDGANISDMQSACDRGGTAVLLAARTAAAIDVALFVD